MGTLLYLSANYCVSHTTFFNFKVYTLIINFIPQEHKKVM